MIKLIVAMTGERLIGKDDKMPWHLPKEFKHFKETTMGHSLLFGRKTFQGLPNKLPGRKHYVLSSNDVEKADQTIHNDEELNKLFDKYRNSEEILFIAGGKSVYEKYAEQADEWIISYVWGNYTGNVYLNLKPVNYSKEGVVVHGDFDVVIYRKIK
ncbi:dihydrofolate reductase [Mycoplasma marinum]|uniref:dihydrofolate reductase n=1 Tax=Mycoplasma marinum TaxID=1937190 RepID=A0A4R0XLB1_9MOLU|nr:dihydrofolate reductase [Mycoplasma marinum]TCG11433.1 dihydrofolate reductase [Mycoplasma marinum]